MLTQTLYRSRVAALEAAQVAQRVVGVVPTMARLVFFQAAPGAVTPTGITENTAYFVGTAATDTFTLSTTTANANPVNSTGAGAGLFTPYTAVTIVNLATPNLAIGTIVCQF